MLVKKLNLIMENYDLHKKLEYHYKAFDRKRISPDPLEVLHHYSEAKDIEVIGLISSIFAYGNVKMILKALNQLETIFERAPFEFLVNYDFRNGKNLLGKFKYRFYSNQDIHNLFRLLSKVLNEYGSLESLFNEGYCNEDVNVKSGINNFSDWFIANCKSMKCFSNGMRFMFPLPKRGSAAKRMNLFLRWMVRNDELDFGLWRCVDKSKLIIPVDVHISRIAQKLGLTSRKNVSWLMAEEITNNLKKYDKTDPVKYDFALCHIGMRKEVF